MKGSVDKSIMFIASLAELPTFLHNVQVAVPKILPESGIKLETERTQIVGCYEKLRLVHTSSAHKPDMSRHRLPCFLPPGAYIAA